MSGDIKFILIIYSNELSIYKNGFDDIEDHPIAKGRDSVRQELALSLSLTRINDIIYE